MITELVLLILVVLALLAVAAVFSAAETGLTAASRGRMHQLERDGDKSAKRVNALLSDQETMIGAVLLGYNVISILTSVLATAFITRMFPGALGIAIATAIMTVLVVVFVEVAPKTLAIARPDDVARALSAPMLLAVRVLGPVIWAVQSIVGAALRVLGLTLGTGDDAAAAHEELRGAVEYHHAEGAVGSVDRRMLGGVLDLAGVTVSEVMVHRRSMSVIDASLPPRELARKALTLEHSRLPLYRDEPENIIGVLHTKDLLRAIVAADGAIDAIDIGRVTREPWFIPETTHLKEQLDAFLKRRRHFALVVDEYGALQGLVTLEDILEEIVGEIDDEHDETIVGLRRLADGWVNIDGDVTVRDLNRAMDWSLPDDLAVTVAGLVIHEARAIPEPGQSFLFQGHRFRVLGRERNQITRLSVSPPAELDTI